MNARYLAWGVWLALVMAGCAGTDRSLRTAWDIGGMCKHCNCTMPSNVDPGAVCPVCKCGFRALHCMRGR